MEQTPMHLRVPSLHDFRLTSAGAADSSLVLHDYEEYELRPSYGSDHAYEYLWINPATSLRQRIRRLTAEIEEARQGCKRERERADGLEVDAANWRSLKQLAAALGAVA